VGGAPEARSRRELSGYYAHVEATDRAIGVLVDAVPDDTIIAVTSVHGDMHGSHGLFRKGWPYEESVRVPLLVRIPGLCGRDDRPVSLLDLPEMAERWAEGTVDSRRTAARPGESAQISMPSVVRLPDQCDRAWSGVRTRFRKLVLNEDGSPWLFFDLEEDPLELRNRAADPSRAGEIAGLSALVSR